MADAVQVAPVQSAGFFSRNNSVGDVTQLSQEATRAGEVAIACELAVNEILNSGPRI